MKIILNEYESYEIKLPDNKEFSIQELSVLVDRLNRVLKIFGRDEIMKNIKEGSIEKRKYIKTKVGNRTYSRANMRPFTKNREIALQLIHTHYWGSDEQKEALAKQLNISWYNIMKAMSGFRKKWNVKPEEVELKAFPNKQNFGDFWKNKEKWRKLKNV
jgi:hypothetical protein